MKKLLCVLLSAIFLAGCTNTVQPTPTPVETPSPTPEVTATPEPTPTIPPLAEIPEEMLVASEGRTADHPYILPEGLPKGTLESGTLLGRAVKDPANDGKYFAVCGHGFGGKLKQLCAALEAAGFRITRAEKSSRIYAVCTEEGLRSLQGGEYGWYFGLVPREVLEHDI